MIKKNLRRFLEKQRVRKYLLVLHSPFAWVIIKCSGVFDQQWYESQYIQRRGYTLFKFSSLLHYIILGRKDGLTPNLYFVADIYDPIRWHASIIDPLVKYLLKKKTWNRPTSLIFDPSTMDREVKSVAPLVEYLRHNNGKIYITDMFHTTNKTKNTSAISIVKEAVDERTKKLAERSASEPLKYFDDKLQKKTIEQYNTDNHSLKAGSPLVSIVTPVWNRQTLIGEAIKSVQDQTLTNWELIIIDDGSSDQSVEVVRSFQANDPRIRLLEPGHGGVCKARNHGLEDARGKWIAFLDSDNTWTKNFLQTSISMLESKKYKASYSAIKMINNGNVRYRTTPPNPKLLETGNYIDLNALIVEKTLLRSVGFFDEALRRMVDYDLVCRISRNAKFLYVPIVGVNYTDHDDLVRISTSESVSWDGVIKSKNFIDWNGAVTGRSKSLVSIIIPVRGSSAPVIKSLKNVLKYTPENNVEIILADASSNSNTNISLRALTLFDDRVRHYREQAAHDTVLVTNYAFTKTKGSTIIILDQHVSVEEGWFESLVLATNNDTIVSPLQLKTNRTIRSAGIEFYGEKSLPVEIFEDHPVQDLNKLESNWKVDAVSSGCIALTAKNFAQLRGLNPLYDGGFESYDFSLRASKIGLTSQVAKDSRVVNPDGGRGWYTKAQDQFMIDWSDETASRTSKLWRLAGFKVDSYVATDQTDSKKAGRVKPRLKRIDKTKRWAIKISAPADERRFSWGDMYYAEALANAFRSKGQFVAVDFLGAHNRSTTYLDDVNLDLRGLTPFSPIKGMTNILWVISHPDDVTVDSVRSYDMVYSAGATWAEYMEAKSGKGVVFLPQCTDPSIFDVRSVDEEYRNKVLFVGNSRNVLRPIVRDAIESGVDVAVYGGGWKGLIDKKYIKGEFIPNDKLASAYGSALVVLNDHWDDMRRWGFLSNRLFDASAAGATVITDKVAGIDETGLKNISTYVDSRELKIMIENIKTQSNTEKLRIHDYTASMHSFESRAERILYDYQHRR